MRSSLIMRTHFVSIKMVTKTNGVHSLSDIFTCHSSYKDILYISIINTKFQCLSTSVYTNKNIPVINICFTTLKYIFFQISLSSLSKVM